MSARMTGGVPLEDMSGKGHGIIRNLAAYYPASEGSLYAMPSALLVRVLLLTRCRMQGASTRDHEARTGRRFEPQGGIHQWPDGSVYKTFRRQQRGQFLSGTSPIER